MPLLLKDRLDALVQLGKRIQVGSDEQERAIRQARFHNQWFTEQNSKEALQAVSEQYLAEENLQQWVSAYELNEPDVPMKVGLVLAGNIPMVGIHDVLSVFVAGHQSLYKLSEKDKFLIPYLIDTLIDIQPRAKVYFEQVEKLTGFEAVIATGSDNSARYFEAYFGKYPNIIRKNRTSVAVLDGEEDEAALKALAKDVFSYFGLGCRNVSKLMVPVDYSFDRLLEVFHDAYKDLALHNKYKNNFDYNYTLYILNKMAHLANGSVLLLEDPSLHSRIACLHYEYYQGQEDLKQKLEREKESIQCLVSGTSVDGFPDVAFGQAQQPALWNYADGVDTLSFLSQLHVRENG